MPSPFRDYLLQKLAVQSTEQQFAQEGAEAPAGAEPEGPGEAPADPQEAAEAPEAPEGGGDLGGALAELLAHMRALHLWMHGAHLASKGPSFAGDHAVILNRIYDEVQDQVDALSEKAIGLTDDESLGDAGRILGMAMPVLQHYPAVSGMPQDQLMATALGVEMAFIALLEETFHQLERAGQLSLGLNNMLAGLADTHEGYAYFLKRRKQG